MNAKLRIAVLIAAAALAAFACKAKTQVEGVDLDVAFGEATLSDNLITDVTYTWKTGGGFKPQDRDYSVYVHFWHNSNLIVQDDYVPDVPTTQWQKDKTYTVKRSLFIPRFIDEFDPAFKGEETLRMSVGFYNPNDRTGKSQREVLSKKLKVVPPPLGTPEIIYDKGWYPQEVDQNSVLKQWRWTQREATCVIDNPRRDARLVIRGGALRGAVKDQKITLMINDLPLDEFLPESDIFEKSYSIKKEQLGSKDEFTLKISVDKPLIPAQHIPGSKDSRELGIQVSMLYFR